MGFAARRLFIIRAVLPQNYNWCHSQNQVVLRGHKSIIRTAQHWNQNQGYMRA